MHFEADTEMQAWVDMFNQCHIVSANGIQRIEWPDGGSYFSQENIVVSMFIVIESVYEGIIKENNRGR